MQSSKPFLQRYLKKLTGWTLWLLLLFIGTLGLFTFLMHEVVWEKEEVIDYRIFAFLSAHVITPGLTGLMKFVTYFASSTFLQLAYGALVLSYLLRKNWKRSAEIAVIGLGGFLINYLMKFS